MAAAPAGEGRATEAASQEAGSQRARAGSSFDGSSLPRGASGEIGVSLEFKAGAADGRGAAGTESGGAKGGASASGAVRNSGSWRGFGEGQATRSNPFVRAEFCGHAGGSILSLEWQPGGTRLVSAADFDSAAARVWDAETGEEVAVFTAGGADNVEASVAWSPDGALVAATASDRSIRVWNVHSGAEVARLVGHERKATAIGWSPDGKYVVGAGRDATARVWDVASSEQQVMLEGHSRIVSDACYSPNGQLIATASQDKTARLWDAADGTAVATLVGHTGDLLAVEWSPDGARVATASVDGTARVWDCASGARVVTLGGGDGPVGAARWSPDGRRILAVCREAAALFDAESGAPLARIAPHGRVNGACGAAAWAPDGQRVAVSFGDIALVVRTSSNAAVELPQHAGEPPSAVSWSADGHCVATMSSADAHVNVCDLHSGANPVRLTGHSGRVAKAVWTDADARVLTCSDVDMTVRVWDPASGALIYASGCVAAAPWSPDTRLLLTLASDGTAPVVDRGTYRVVSTLAGDWSGANMVVWSPDSTRVVAEIDESAGAQVFNATTGAAVSQVIGSVLPNAWSPDSKWIVTARDSGAALVHLSDATTGESVACGDGDMDDVASVAWFSDASGLVGVSTTGVAVAWSCLDARTLAKFPCHDEPLIAPGQHRVLAVAGKEASVWDCDTGAQQFTLDGHGRRISAASWSSSAALILTVAEDNCLRLWSGFDGTQLVSIAGSGSTLDATTCSWSPDGARCLAVLSHHDVAQRCGLVFDTDAVIARGAPLALCQWVRNIPELSSAGGAGRERAVDALVEHASWYPLVMLGADAADVETAAAAGPHGPGVERPCALVQCLIARYGLHEAVYRLDAKWTLTWTRATRYMGDTDESPLQIALRYRQVDTVRAILMRLLELVQVQPHIAAASPASELYYVDAYLRDAADIQQQVLGVSAAGPRGSDVECALFERPLASANVRDTYPELATWFISHLPMVGYATHPALFTSSLLGVDRWLFGAGQDKRRTSTLMHREVGLWRCIGDSERVGGAAGDAGPDRDREQAGTLVDGFVTPLPLNAEGALRVLATVANNRVWGGDVMRVLLDHKWEQYGRAWYLRQTAAYAVFLAAFTIAAVLNARFDTEGHETLLVALRVLLGLSCARYFFLEVLQVFRVRSVKLKYADPWNVADVLTIVGVSVYCILPGPWAASGASGDGEVDGEVDGESVQSTVDTETPLLLASALTAVLWSKTLYFLRGYRATGPLVRIILEIVGDMGSLCLIILLLGAGFGFALYQLFPDEPLDPHTLDDVTDFEGGGMVGITMLRMTLGDFDLGVFEDHAASFTLAVSLFALYVVFVVVVLLNALIALMGDTWERVNENMQAQFARGRAELLLEAETYMSQQWPHDRVVERLLSCCRCCDAPRWARAMGVASVNRKSDPWVHELRERHVEDREDGSGAWQGRLNAIRKSISSTARSTQAQIARGSTALQAKIATLQSATSSNTDALAEMSAAVAALQRESRTAHARMKRVESMLGVLHRGAPRGRAADGDT